MRAGLMCAAWPAHLERDIIILGFAEYIAKYYHITGFRSEKLSFFFNFPKNYHKSGGLFQKTQVA